VLNEFRQPVARGVAQLAEPTGATKCPECNGTRLYKGFGREDSCTTCAA
jgi:uncharacterized protein (DUF983 family)